MSMGRLFLTSFQLSEEFTFFAYCANIYIIKLKEENSVKKEKLKKRMINNSSG